MSGKDRSWTWKSELLDRLFWNKKISMGIALSLATVVYVLALFFGNEEASGMQFYRPLILGVFSFVAVLLVAGIQLNNRHCSADMMDFLELFFALGELVMIAIWMVAYGFRMLFTEEAYITANMVLGSAGLWCALCLVHNKRN